MNEKVVQIVSILLVVIMLAAFIIPLFIAS